MRIRGTTVTTPMSRTAVVNDAIVSGKPWSSKNTVDKLAPAFTESGAIVTCEPVEGYPLDAVSHIVPVQEGSGTPSSDNILPIRGYSGANLTHNDATVHADFGETVYSGTYNWTTGLLTITHKMVVLTSDMGWRMTGDKNPNGIKSFYTDVFDENARDTLNTDTLPTSSHYMAYAGGWSVNSVAFQQAIKVLNQKVYIADARFNDLDSFRAFIDANEVQVVYPLVPITVQLSEQEILGLAGENTFHSDTGDTTVTGRADPTAIINKLTNAIVALGANI